MNLMGEDFVQPKEEKAKKTSKGLLIAIIVVFVIIVFLMIIIPSLKTKPLKVSLDGQDNTDIKTLLIFDENNEVHIPIKEIAEFLQYTAYSGDYAVKSEDESKCYVEIDEEAVVFEAGSNKIEKINKSTSESAFYEIDEPVQVIDGKLYTTKDGISKAFNVYFDYDAEDKQVTIQTLSFIIGEYQKAAIEFGFEDISTKFNDSKAALQDLVIVRKANKVGIFNMNTKKKVLETKYDDIEFLPYTNEFLITSNGNKGIKDIEGKDIIKTQYEDIEQVSQDLDLYVVKKDGKYGMIDKEEKTIISPLLNKIGIDIKAYSKNNVKNKYVLLDRYVPIMYDNKWALVTIDGKVITDLKYDNFGCQTSNGSGVIVIPEYNLIIGMRNKKYYLIDENGNELGNKVGKGIGFDQVYLEIELEKVTYHVKIDNDTADAEQVIERLQSNMKKNEKEANQNNEETEENQDEQEENEENNNEEENYYDEEDNENEESYDEENGEE